jgi:hypothetical protein
MYAQIVIMQLAGFNFISRNMFLHSIKIDCTTAKKCLVLLSKVLQIFASNKCKHKCDHLRLLHYYDTKTQQNRTEG